MQGRVETIFLAGEDARQSGLDALLPYGELLSTALSRDYLGLYSRDAQSVHSMPALAICKPHSVECISHILKLAGEYGLSVTPRCGGTGLSGGALAAQGGLVLLMGHLRRVRSLSIESQRCVVEGGLAPAWLNRKLSKDKLCFPCSMETAAVAGMGACIATGAFAAQSYQGAQLLDYVHAVEVVDASGKFTWLSPRAMSGSEGTRGIITRLELQLLRSPEATLSSVKQCSLEEAIDCLQAQAPILSLQSCVWREGVLYLQQAGEAWRVQPIQGMEEGEPAPSLWTHIAPAQEYLVFASTVASTQHGVALKRLAEIAAAHRLDLQWQWDLLHGQLQIRISRAESPADFRLRVTKFLEVWTNTLHTLGASLGGAYGMGALLSPFMPAFTSEASIAWLGRKKDAVCALGNLAPRMGKCVERRRGGGG